MTNTIIGVSAFSVLVVLSIVKTPAALRERDRRAGTLACWFGTLAFASLGFYEPVDRLLGGSNVAKLSQTFFATLAFWAMAQAVHKIVPADERPAARKVWIFSAFVVCMVATSVIAFFSFAGRPATTPEFLESYATDGRVWLYASSYMLTVVLLCVSILSALRARRAPSNWFFRGGATSVILGSLAEIGNLTLSNLQIAKAEAGLLYVAFQALFYGGILAILVGFIVIGVGRRKRLIQLPALGLPLDEILSTQFETRTSPRTSFGLYRQCIEIRDMECNQNLVLTDSEELTVASAEEYLRRCMVGEVSGRVRGRDR